MPGTCVHGDGAARHGAALGVFIYIFVDRMAAANEAVIGALHRCVKLSN